MQIRRALCVDPLTRITIDEIRCERALASCAPTGPHTARAASAHRWFVVDLPAYLARAPRDVARRSVLAVDPDVVSELQSALGHRNVSVAEIEQAVAAGAAADGSMDALAVAYHLIYDQKYCASAAAAACVRARRALSALLQPKIGVTDARARTRAAPRRALVLPSAPGARARAPRRLSLRSLGRQHSHRRRKARRR